MIEENILRALQTRTNAAVAGAGDTTVKIKPVGITLKPAATDKWLEQVYIPNNVKNEFWNSGKTYRGLFRLLLHWPVNAKGIYPAMAYAALIGEFFSKGTMLSDGNVVVKIYEEPDLTGIIEEPAGSILPISVRYMCYKA